MWSFWAIDDDSRPLTTSFMDIVLILLCRQLINYRWQARLRHKMTSLINTRVSTNIPLIKWFYRGSIESLSRVYRESIKGLSRVLSRLSRVYLVYQGSIEGLSRLSRVYWGSIEGLSRVYREFIENLFKCTEGGEEYSQAPSRLSNLQVSKCLKIKR
jgi:hypothetical protein